MTDGVTTLNVDPVAIADQVLVNRLGSTGLQTVDDLAKQLAGSGAVAEAITSASEGVQGASTWAQLSAISAGVGKLGRVTGPDNGTHSDPDTGQTVPNAGEYIKVAAGWKRTRDLINAAAINSHIADRTNPHQVTADQVGLGDVNERIGVNVPLYGDRPGDSPHNFVDELTGGDPVAIPELAIGIQASDENGRARRITGAGLVAIRAMYPMEPDKVYLVEFVVQRRVNTPDPSNDAVRCALAWYDQRMGTFAPAFTIVKDITALTTGSGRVLVTAVVGRVAGDGIDIVSPANARYVRPYVQTYGASPQTDIEVIRWTDITNVSSYSPDLAALEGRVSAQESLDLGARTTALEQQVTSPNSMRYATVGDLMSANIPVSADTVEILGYSEAGDGGHHRRVRIAAPSSPQPWQKQSDDGAWWEVSTNNLNVLVFGADKTGMIDAEPAFTLAACAVRANGGDNNILSDQPSSDWASVRVPYGVYTLDSVVDTNNKEIVWVLDPGTEIINPENINGRIYREGYKVVSFPHHGIAGNATTFSVQANRTPDNPPGVSGFTHPANISAGNGSDSVALYVDNILPPALYGTDTVASYDATSVTLATAMTADQLKKMRKGMMVQTRHAPQSYRGMINGWTDTTISVEDGWFLVDGSQMGTPSTPPGTDGLDINPFRSAWAANIVAFLGPNSWGNNLTGIELGVQNTKGPIAADGGKVSAVGLQIINLKSSTETNYRMDTGLVISGEFRKAYRALRGSEYAFMYEGNTGGGTTALAHLLYGVDPNGHQFYDIDGSGNVKMGLTGVAGTTTLDLRSSGLNASFDVRLQASGGLATGGAGTLTISSASVDFTGVPRPTGDNTASLGQPGRRWSSLRATVLYIGDGTVSIRGGVGSPEGVITANVGSKYYRTDGGAGTSEYTKESGAGNTGWVGK